MPLKFEIKYGKLYEFGNPNPVTPEIFNEDHIRFFRLFQSINDKSKNIGLPISFYFDEYNIIDTSNIVTYCSLTCICGNKLSVKRLKKSFKKTNPISKYMHQQAFKNKLIEELKHHLMIDEDQIRCKKCDSFYEFYEIHDEIRALKIN